MESGLCCTLDPAGGNEVNFRAVLRAAEIKWRQPAASDDVAEAEADGSDSEEAPVQQPTRGRNTDDYDYDDDFIDDEELFQHEENDAPPPDNDDDLPLLFEPHATRFDQPLPIVRACDSSFYVNRGDIRPKKKIDALVRKVRARTQAVAAATTGAAAYPDIASSYTSAPAASPKPKKATSGAGAPASKGGDKTKAKKVSFAAENTATTSKATKAKKPATTKSTSAKKTKRPAAGETKSSKRPLKQQKITIGAKTAPSATPAAPVSAASAVAALAGKSGAKRPKADSPKQAKPLAPAVVAEVEKLRALCASVFGEKKPNLLDGQVQTQLRTLFNVAAKHKLAKLHTDAQRDNRCFKLTDELWAALSGVLRTTRPYTEQLGHGLHWKGIEEEETAVVEVAERGVADVLGTTTDDTLQMEPFDPKVLATLRNLLATRTKLNEAQNQLATRSRSVRKAIPSWAAALKKNALAQSALTEDKLCAALRKVDEINVNEAKRKKEEEKEAKRKKRIEKETAPKQGLPPALRNLASLKAKAPPAKPAPSKGDGTQ